MVSVTSAAVLRSRRGNPTPACIIETVHTPTMTIKAATLLALAGIMVLTVVLAADFIKMFLGFLRDVVPALALLRSLVYLFASLTMAVFLYVMHKTHS